MPTVLVKAHLPNEKDQIFEVQLGALIFDELENQGCILPHGCLAGSCGSCRIEITKGAENLSPAGAVEQNTIDALTSLILALPFVWPVGQKLWEKLKSLS